MNDVEREAMVEKAAKPDQASLDLLIRGAEKTFDNAERLFHEAEILAKEGAVARALCLHQISLEECSKVNNLGAWAVSLDLRRDQRFFRTVQGLDDARARTGLGRVIAHDQFAARLQRIARDREQARRDRPAWQ